MPKNLLIAFVAALLNACAIPIEHTDIFKSRDKRVAVENLVLPSSADRSRIQEISVTAEGRTFYGYRVAANAPTAAVIFFPGNAYGAPNAIGQLTALFHNAQTDLYIVSYGLSGEEPPLVKQSFAMGVELAAFAARTSGVPQARVRAVGHSLGGWVAMNAASLGKVGCVVIAGSGTTAKETVRQILPKVVSWAIPLKASKDVELLNNPALARAVKVPLLVVGSEVDEVMTVQATDTIFRSVGDPESARLFISKNVSHAKYFTDIEVQKAVSSFISDKCER
jgi:hypothetical protein